VPVILETLPAVKSLRSDDKLKLAYELWDDVSSENLPLDPAAEKLLSERLAAYDANPDNVLAAEQAAQRMEQFKARLASDRAGKHE